MDRIISHSLHFTPRPFPAENGTTGIALTPTGTTQECCTDAGATKILAWQRSLQMSQFLLFSLVIVGRRLQTVDGGSLA
jgi:hypothetical protein